MILEPRDQALIAAFREVVREELNRTPARLPRVGSMTVAEFAHVVQLSYEVVLRKIRSRSIPAEYVSKKAKVFRIKPEALAAFGVSKDEAAARLAKADTPTRA